VRQEGPATCTLDRPMQAVTRTSWPGSSDLEGGVPPVALWATGP